MADVVLDANVIVALLYAEDAHHEHARQMIDRLERDGDEIVLIDFLVGEATSVMCRRARERKTNPPDLATALATIRSWFRDGHVRAYGHHTVQLVDRVLDVIGDTGGALNFNDALVVVLQREGLIEDVASFDSGFDVVQDFRRTD